MIYKWPSMRIRKIYNPVSGSEENKIVISSVDGPDKIILQTDELDDVLSKFYLETIGDGSMKLKNGSRGCSLV